MPDNRGTIINRERARQIRDFSGLRFGNITPTDTDGHIEWHDKAHIFFELKYGTTRLPFGQRLALERLIDDLEHVKPTIGIIASHNTHNTADSIDCANSSVMEFRREGKWYMTSGTITLKNLIDLFLNNLELGAQELFCLCVENRHLPEKVPLASFMK